MSHDTGIIVAKATAKACESPSRTDHANASFTTVP